MCAWRTLFAAISRLNVVVSCGPVRAFYPALFVQRSVRSDEDGDPETPVDDGMVSFEGQTDSPVSEEPPPDGNDGFRDGDMVEREAKGPRRCRFCPFVTQFPSALTRHERIHTGEKPFKCRYCSFRSAQRCHAVRHEAQHTSRKAGRRRAAKALAARVERKLADAANTPSASRDFAGAHVKMEGIAAGAVVGPGDMPAAVGPDPAVYGPSTRFPPVYQPSGYSYVDSRDATWVGQGFVEANQLNPRVLPYTNSFPSRFGYSGGPAESTPYYYNQLAPYSSPYGVAVPVVPRYAPAYSPTTSVQSRSHAAAVESAASSVLRCTEGWTAVLQPTAFRLRNPAPQYDPVTAFGYPSTASEKRWRPYPHLPARTPPSSFGVPPYGSSWTPTPPFTGVPSGESLGSMRVHSR
jgi:hypothetical protein